MDKGESKIKRPWQFDGNISELQSVFTFLLAIKSVLEWLRIKVSSLSHCELIAGPFPAILGKGSGLNWEKICSIMGYFGNFF